MSCTYRKACCRTRSEDARGSCLVLQAPSLWVQDMTLGIRQGPRWSGEAESNWGGTSVNLLGLGPIPIPITAGSLPHLNLDLERSYPGILPLKQHPLHGLRRLCFARLSVARTSTVATLRSPFPSGFVAGGHLR